jgi:hypothetical protein
MTSAALAQESRPSSWVRYGVRGEGNEVGFMDATASQQTRSHLATSIPNLARRKHPSLSSIVQQQSLLEVQHYDDNPLCKNSILILLRETLEESSILRPLQK